MKPLSLLAVAAVALYSCTAHGSKEQETLCELGVPKDATSLLQDAMFKSRDALWVNDQLLSAGSRNRPLDSASLSVNAGVADLDVADSWPHLQQSLSQLITSLTTAPVLPSHPFPSLDWSEVKMPSALICAVVLFCAGVLCSAGGIGGGGVYVTVLMVAGQLTPHDAVPLSKSVVFFGSLASLVLNLRKSLATPPNGGQAKVLIDYNICRLVVPSALFGTLMGVLLNSVVPPWLIVAMLVGILCLMTWMSCKQFYKHYTEEATENFMMQGSSSDEDGLNEGRLGGSSPSAEMFKSRELAKKASEEATAKSIRGILCKGEGFGAFCLLLMVICCGALRAHAENCRTDLIQDASGEYGRDSCQRPIIKAFFGSDLVTWMAPQATQYAGTAGFLLYGTILVPASICLGVVIGYSMYLAKQEHWPTRDIALYCTMALLTGCFAGLVGIGGGLVFSPFILWMSGDPAIAVATSSTLVIFTSSSTTFQYLFTDRITMSLTIIYGLINLTASYVGTTTVHMMDTLENRKTVISGIVCCGVIASVILSVYKLCSMGVAH